jgi:hypothetical protein
LPHIAAAPRAFFLIFSVTHGDAVARCSAMPTVGLLPVARVGHAGRRAVDYEPSWPLKARSYLTSHALYAAPMRAIGVKRAQVFNPVTCVLSLGWA